MNIWDNPQYGTFLETGSFHKSLARTRASKELVEEWTRPKLTLTPRQQILFLLHISWLQVIYSNLQSKISEYIKFA